MLTLTILVVFLQFCCLHPFALGYDLDLVKESVFLGDSVKRWQENATKCEHMAPVIFHMHCHFNFATECTAQGLKFAPKGLMG